MPNPVLRVHERPLGDPVAVFIGQLRNSVPNAVTVFTQGNCFQLFLLLRQVFPQAQPYYHLVEGHAYTKIDGIFYDIHGQVKHQQKLKACLNGGGLIHFTEEPRIFRQAFRWKYDPTIFTTARKESHDDDVE